MRHPYGETVGIRPVIEASDDSHGNAAQSWGDPVQWSGCAIAPASTIESAGDSRDATTTTLTVYGPPDLQATPRDLAVYRDLEWEIVGTVENWRNPFNSSTPGIVLTIRRTDG